MSCYFVQDRDNHFDAGFHQSIMDEPKAKRPKLCEQKIKDFSVHSENIIREVTRLKGHVDKDSFLRNVQTFTNCKGIHLKVSADEKDAVLRGLFSENEDEIRVFLLEITNTEYLVAIIANPAIYHEAFLQHLIIKCLNKEDPVSVIKSSIKTTDWHKHLEFWDPLLKNCQIRLTFPNTVNNVQTEKCGQLDVQLSMATTTSIRQFLSKHEIAMSEVFFTALQVFLKRYTKQNDFCVVTSISECLQNSIFFPCNVSSELTFLQKISKVRSQLSEMALHSDVPVHYIKTKLLSLSDCAIYFKFTKNMTDVDISNYPTTNNYQVQIHVIENRQDSITVSFVYNNLFSDETIKTISKHFQTILTSLITSPEEKIASHSLLTAKDIELFQRWNNTLDPFCEDAMIHHLFEAQVLLLSPEAEAIVFLNDRISYRSLNQKANVLARHLSIANGTVVGICMEKNIDQIVAFMAVLKRESAYVPIDPTFPLERINFIINDAKIQLTIIKKSFKDALPTSASTFDFDSVDLTANDDGFSIKNDKSSSNNAAYILYTSGTTGNPKGVSITHKNVVAFVHSLEKSISNDEGSGTLLSASPNFCIFHALLYYTLTTGKKSILAPTMLHVSQLSAKNEITLIATATSTFRPLMENGQLPTSLRTIFFGGDAVDFHTLKTLREMRPDVNIYTCHGCTETTLLDLCGRLDELSENINAGSPVPNMKVYIVDSDLQRVPLDLAGELCISGPQVTQAYLNLPQKTAKKFVKNRFEKTGGNYKIMYRTGDLARWTKSGKVEIIGRMDFMVKINGLRIELDEITHALLSSESIKEAVVTVLQSNKNRLVAYFTPKELDQTNVDELKDYLKKKLPFYMIPQFYVQMKKIPRNKNGKVDRSLLPEPNIQINSTNDDEPTTETEKTVLNMIRNLLNHQIGLTDNLIANGLDSIVAIQFAIQLENIFKINLPVMTIFDKATVMRLSRTIDDISLGRIDQRTEFDALREALILDKEIGLFKISKSLKMTSGPKNIFLTGATGFLGAFLLADILKLTKDRVFCLVRAEDISKGFQRLKSNLEFYGVWKSEFSCRLEIVIGDLTQQNFSLSTEEYKNLSTIIQTIYHCAATVNFILPFSAMKNDVKEILRFAFADQMKVLHYVSSIAVHGSRREGLQNSIKYETCDIKSSIPDLPDMGYAQMKWVSEKLVWLAKSKGLPVTILRPCFVCSHSETGSVSTQEFITRLIKDCIEMKAYPAVDASIHLVNVDYFSSAAVLISLDEKNLGKAFHLTPADGKGLKIKKLMRMAMNCGFHMEEITLDNWLEKIQKEKMSVFPLLQFAKVQLKDEKSWVFDTSQTKAALEKANLHFTPVSIRSIQLLIDFLIKKEFINPPNIR